MWIDGKHTLNNNPKKHDQGPSKVEGLVWALGPLQGQQGQHGQFGVFL